MNTVLKSAPPVDDQVAVQAPGQGERSINLKTRWWRIAGGIATAQKDWWERISGLVTVFARNCLPAHYRLSSARLARS